MSEYNIKMKGKISSLTSVTQLLDVPKEVITTYTGDTIDSIIAGNTDHVCIGRTGRIDRVDINGTTSESIKTLSGFFPSSLTITQEGHLIYTDWMVKTVNLVRNGKVETVIRTGDWEPSRVCSTSTGDLLVCLHKNKKHKVVRYSGYEVKQEIQFDEKKKPLFANGHAYPFIAENRDQSICVSDSKAHTVVVLNQEGRVQFRYDGNLASSKYVSFTPRGIATDSQSRILIADRDNNCVHIISCDGKFLRYIENCHLVKPFVLSIDSMDRLFVSGSRSSSLKIIKYMK